MVQPRILSDAEKLAWLRLSRTDRVGPHTFFELLNFYGTAEKALEAIPEMAKRGGSKKALVPFSEAKAKQEINKTAQYGARMVAYSEAEYPDALRHIPDPPPLISVLGNADIFSDKSLAIVGARNASMNGIRFCEKLVKEMVGTHGYVIVSGLARGVDTAAHQAALKTQNEGSTIAVIAGGINDIYPKENAELYAKIAGGGGCIIAESSFGHPPRAHDFPRRNRIISGLSLGTLVIEASVRSGSLITAARASDQGREVMAIPGFPLDPRAGGPNKLIKQGAALIETAEDILHALNFAQMTSIKPPLEEGESVFISAPPSENEYGRIQEELLSQLSPHPTEVDDIIEALGAGPNLVLPVLLELELAGRITRHPGNKISLLI